MHKFSFVPVFRRLAVLPSIFLLSAVAALSPSTTAYAQTTTFQGTVYSPFGPTAGTFGYAGDPIPNILVFAQDTAAADAADGALPKFSQGVTVPAAGANGCDAQQNLLPKSYLGGALTDTSGNFSFSITGTPDPVVMVIQAGKWRRIYSFPLSQFKVGAVNSGIVMSMPSAQQGPVVSGGPNIADLPHIAVVTGAADEVECIFRQIGIDDKDEITDPTGTGSINLFVGDGKATGGSGGGTSTTTVQKESSLLNGTVPITNYDLVMFGCQGSSTIDPNPKNTNGLNPNYKTVLADYTSDGGRILLTHYGWPFIANTTDFSGVASWFPASINTNTEATNVPYTGQLNSAYVGYPTLEGWLNNIGALTSTNPANLQFENIRQDIGNISPTAQVWATIPSFTTATTQGLTPSQAIQFTFDTPIGPAGTPQATLTFTNNTTTFVQGDTGDKITLTVANTGTVVTSGSALSLAINLPAAMTNATLVDSSGGSWVCSVAGAVGTCNASAPLAAGASDSVLLTFDIPAAATPGQEGLTAKLSGGNLDNSTQCGRVLFNDYHVEEPTANITNGESYANGAHCPSSTGGLKAAQKFLEYSLYALSNFVSPSTTDLLLIQGAANLTWTPAANSFYYGTPYTPNSALDNASASGIAGSFTYTADSTINPLDVGMHTITATFTPTDPNYISSGINTKITVVSDPTASTLDTSAPLPTLFYGQPLVYPGGLSAAVDIKVIAPGYTTQPVNAGAYSITLDGNVACTGTAGGANTCATPTIGTLDAGTHNVQLSYAGTANSDFLSSNSPLYPVVISPDPTTTTMTASATTSVNLQPLTFTAAVTDTYTAAVGPVTFYDSTTTGSTAGTTPVGSPIGTATLDGTGHATLTSTTVFTGTHYISACFTPALNSLNTYNYVLSCSASTQIVVTTIPPSNPLATSTVLSSSANPSAVGQAVSFTATVATSGSFTTIPTGSVKFLDGASALSTVPLDATGAAVFTTSALAVGNHSITAVYAGSTTLAGSTSTVLTQIVNTPVGSAGTGFLLVFGTTGIDVPIGSSGTVQIRAIELNNFNQPIKFACSGLPAETACTFSTDTLPASGGTTQLWVSAQAAHNCNASSPYFVASAGETGCLAFAVLVLCLARRRRKLQGLALLVLFALLPLVLAGCGSNCTDFGVKPGTYTFTITATSTGSPVVVQTQAMTMNAHL